MFDFGNAMKVIVTFGTGAFVLIMAGLGVKVLFFRRRQLPGMVDNEEIEALDERLLRTEAKVNELEERLDFAERMLGEVRGKPQIPGQP